jgi:hypothetical protein
MRGRLECWRQWRWGCSGRPPPSRHLSA